MNNTVYTKHFGLWVAPFLKNIEIRCPGKHSSALFDVRNTFFCTDFFFFLYIYKLGLYNVSNTEKWLRRWVATSDICMIHLICVTSWRVFVYTGSLYYNTDVHNGKMTPISVLFNVCSGMCSQRCMLNWDLTTNDIFTIIQVFVSIVAWELR